MKRLAVILLVLGCAAPASAVKIGQTWEEVEAELGKPVNRLDAPGRSIGRWQDLEVIFTGGRVESFVRRDLTSEAASEARRKEESARLLRLREEIENEKRKHEEESAGSQLERERRAQAAKVASLEAQLEAERKRLKALTDKTEEQAREESAARERLLRREIPLLRQEIQRALSVGEVERASRLQQELLAKENQLKAQTR